MTRLSVNDISQKRLKKVLKYNKITGLFTWKYQTNPSIKIGSVAGSKMTQGYITIRIDTIAHLAHRLAFLYVDGYLPENEVDHIDRVKDNNAWSNLREVSKSCNMRNKPLHKNNKSGVNGVNMYKKYGKWEAQIGKDGKIIRLCRYYDLADAVRARWEAEKIYGYPNCNTISTAYLYLKERGLI